MRNAGTVAGRRGSVEREKTGTAERIVTTLIGWIDRRQLSHAATLHEATLLKFYSASILLTAFEAAHHAEEHPHAAIGTILLATAGAEAFIHELAAHIDRCNKARDWTPDAITPSLIAAAHAIAEPHGLIDKYVAAAAALGKPFDAGSRVLKDARRLVGLQQCIVGCGLEHRAETLTDELATRDIAKARHPEQLPWFRRLQTPATATWASRGACALILATLDLMPRKAIEPMSAVQALYQGLQT